MKECEECVQNNTSHCQSRPTLSADQTQHAENSAAPRRQRARRQPEYSLARLWEAMALYDLFGTENEVRWKEIGANVRALTEEDQRAVNLSQRGRNIMELMERMLETARQPPGEWMKTFL